MKFGGPWNLRGLRPETVEAACEAARRSGMSVGQWLNDIIQDRDEYRRASTQPDYADNYGWPDEFGEIHARLDTLTEQLEQLARGGAPLRGAPMQPPQRARPQQAWPRTRRPSDNVRSSEGLDNERVDTSREADLPPPAPHDASGPSGLDQEFPQLEEQLRRITAQIEALRPSTELDKVIAGFRGDLADISRQLTEALPRQAVESLCAEVEALARRIDHSRQLSVDLDAIAGIEHGLAEVRDALGGMRTAENLVGLDDALKALAQKLDLIVARQDPVALEQLETAIGALRGVVSHVASNDALNKVAEDVRGLAAKIDALAKGAVTGHAVSALGSRIDALADALKASTEAGQAVPRELEKLLSGLIEKLEGVREAAADPATFQRLEERITQLIGRLDVSDARLGNLAAIERSLTDLLAHIDELRGDRSPVLSPPGAVDAIARDVAEIKRSELRTQDSLEAVHDTVEQVVGRLAMIESDINDAGMRAPAHQRRPGSRREHCGNCGGKQRHDGAEPWRKPWQRQASPCYGGCGQAGFYRRGAPCRPSGYSFSRRRNALRFATPPPQIAIGRPWVSAGE
jgi:localization factor PodJL